ncbi:MAG: glycosyltransferase [Lachnospiraceae bacterium]|nr:glycosyltransferase [Lachnospiraceae bacterium]
MGEIKISIIVPVYNGEKYIRPLMESIAAQTERGFELIVVDDGSRDDGIKIINEYKDKIPHLTVLTQSNSGVSVARNNGISAAKGEYFCFCDADDVVAPDYLEVFSKVIDQYSPDVVICGYQIFYGETTNIKALSTLPNSKDLYK